MVYKNIQEMAGYTKVYKRWYDIQEYTRDGRIYKSIREIVGYTRVYKRCQDIQEYTRDGIIYKSIQETIGYTPVQGKTRIKWAVCVISSDPPYKDGYRAQSTSTPLKLLTVIED